MTAFDKKVNRVDLTLTPEWHRRWLIKTVGLIIMWCSILWGGLFFVAFILPPLAPTLVGKTNPHDFFSELVAINGTSWISWLTWPKVILPLLVVATITVSYITVKRLHQAYQRQQFLELLHRWIYDEDERLKGKLVVDDPFLTNIVEDLNHLLSNSEYFRSETDKLIQGREELISNISHDLRTPLTSVLGYLGLVENRADQSDEQLRRYVHIAYKKAEQMRDLVEDLFEYTQSQDAQLLNVRDFSVVTMVEQLGLDYQLEAKRHGLTVEVTVSDPNLHMVGDVLKLGRVLSNLINNAFRYAEGAHHLWLTASQEQHNIVLTVANDGAPIPREKIAYIFDRFYRGDPSRSAITGGSGLGLAIAKNIVSMHGGEISVTSNDEITRFVLVLPQNMTHSLQAQRYVNKLEKDKE